METRPRINLTLSRLDKTLELASKILLLFMWSFTLYSFFRLPAIIPGHFNALGEVNSYEKKWTLWVLPVIGTIIYAGLTQLNKYPHIFNYMTKITMANAQQQYRSATRMLRFLKAAILLVFAWIILFTYLTSTGTTNGLGIWFLPFTLALLVLPTILLIIQSFRKKNI